jgi:hypothetical protein
MRRWERASDVANAVTSAFGGVPTGAVTPRAVAETLDHVVVVMLGGATPWISSIHSADS